MVNFNNDTTVSTPPGDVVKMVVLESRAQVIEALEHYYIAKNGDTELSAKADLLYGRLLNLWYQLQAMVKRRNKEEYEELCEKIHKGLKFDEMKELFEWLNEFIDQMGLTVIDNRPRYDRTITEDANIKKGL